MPPARLILGHMDGVNKMCRHPIQIGRLISGSCDGEVRVWNLSTRTCMFNRALHTYAYYIYVYVYICVYTVFVNTCIT